MSQTIEVTELVKLGVKDDEILVVKLPVGTPRATIEAMGRTFRSLNPTFKVMIMPDNVNFEVIKAEAAPAAPEEKKPTFCEGCDCGKAEGCRE